ncbi:MAG TPA: zinc-binding dehydrogenase, partial [Steroidobacteraceae bacterium]|nr:zinc-binding dehydrogenase [Steroidobacteraceae bacterium]
LKDGLRRLTGGKGADIIFDPVGGSYAEAALRSIAWNGRFLVVGFPAGIPKIPLNLPLLKNCQIVGVFWGDSVARRPQQHAQNMAELLALYSEGRIRPMVTERFPLARGGEAIARLGARATRGKLAVVMGES